MRSKKNNKRNFLINIIRLISIIIIIYCSVYIYNWYKENNYNKNIIKNVQNAITEKDIFSTDPDNPLNFIDTPAISIDFDSLKTQNSETVGWIKINNTEVNYPIVKHSDNDFYLTHSFDKKYNSGGWIFGDYRCDFENLSSNTVIYGHNRENNSMFGSLPNCSKPEWYTKPENQKIIVTNTTNYMEWQIFSIYVIEAEEYYLKTDFNNTNSYNNFLNTLKSRSINNFNVELNENDKILTLSTCTNYMNNRLVIHAKLVNSIPFNQQ